MTPLALIYASALSFFACKMSLNSIVKGCFSSPTFSDEGLAGKIDILLIGL